MTALHHRSATQLASLIRRRKVGCLELLDHYLARVDRLNPAINAIVWMDRAGARKRARQADAALAKGELWGPLHGLPMTVKEAYDLAGSPSTHGIPAWRDNIAQTDSVVVARLKAAGAVIFGKTNLPYAMADWQSYNDIYGTTRNPWNTDLVPGGSSGGSAAALAAGLTGAEAGSDIGSSIRNPAHYTGTFGLKPTWGIVSQRGHAPPQWLHQPDVAVVGPMTRSAADLQLLLDVMAGPDPIDAGAWQLALAKPRLKSLKGLRIALKLGDPNVAVEREYADVLQTLADRLAQAGAKVSDRAAPQVDLTRQHDLYLTLYRAALSAGTETDIANWRAALGTPLGRTNARMLRGMLEGNTLSHRQWLQLANERMHLRQRWAEFFEELGHPAVPGRGRAGLAARPCRRALDAQDHRQRQARAGDRPAVLVGHFGRGAAAVHRRPGRLHEERVAAGLSGHRRPRPGPHGAAVQPAGGTRVRRLRRAAGLRVARLRACG